MGLIPVFSPVSTEICHISKACTRVLARNIRADRDMPGFRRSTMDGYAVNAAATFGASESSPAWLVLGGTIAMGDAPDFVLKAGQAAKISTGGMLPEGADSVVMVEHTEPVDETTVEVYKSVAPLQHVVEKDEDFRKGQEILRSGTLMRPQEVGLAASLGISELMVYRTPRVGIISTGDEIVPVEETPASGKVRDVNSHTLAGLVGEAGAEPVSYGIVKDDKQALIDVCQRAVTETDMVLISGGSSVGVRDYTVTALSSLENTSMLLHGISISPGKPTILANSGGRPVWGLPGHVVSAMVVFRMVVSPFLKRLKGLTEYAHQAIRVQATLTRNIASAQGRTDFVRIKLTRDKNRLFATPLPGKSGLLRTMVLADGLLEIGENVEGMEKDAQVAILPI